MNRPLTEEERRARTRSEIESALHMSGGRIFGAGGAAELLGLKPTTLRSRMKVLGIGRS
jgi:transcriptional regulator with GAF, ATPase, and Fis domain